MSGFRDIHAHFVCGLDDGAQTQQDMEAMLDAAYADGIAFLFATPHVIPGIKPFDDAKFERHLALARAYCQAKGYAITLYKGAEIMYTPAIEPYVRDQRLPTLGGEQVVLVEFTPQIAYDELESAVDLMESHGYSVILAHIERYRCLCAARGAYRLKREHDVRYQVNCSTVIGGKGFWRDRLVARWLRDELIDYVGTDAHNCQSRPTNMTKAYEALRRKVEPAYADQLTGLR